MPDRGNRWVLAACQTETCLGNQQSRTESFFVCSGLPDGRKLGDQRHRTESWLTNPGRASGNGLTTRQVHCREMAAIVHFSNGAGWASMQWRRLGYNPAAFRINLFGRSGHFRFVGQHCEKTPKRKRSFPWTCHHVSPP